jgi:hypothetical protein
VSGAIKKRCPSHGAKGFVVAVEKIIIMSIIICGIIYC